MGQKQLFAGTRTFIKTEKLDFIIVVVVGWRLLLEIVNHIVPHIVKVNAAYVSYQSYLAPTIANTAHGLGRWAHWDGFHYLNIVVRGYYTGTPGISPSVVFFPAFPMLVKVIDKLIPINPIFIGLIINFVLSIILGWVVYKTTLLMCERYTPQLVKREHYIARLSVLLLFLCPASLFFAAFYADALLVTTSTLSIYFGLKSDYYIAVVFAAIATASKSTAIILIPTLLIIMLENEKVSPGQYKKMLNWQWVWKVVVICFGSALGLIVFMAYLWHRFGSPLVFYTTENMWDRHPSSFFLRRLWGVYYQHTFQPAYYGSTYQFASMMIVQAVPIVVIVLSVWFGLRYRAYWVPAMSILMLLLPLSTAVMESLNRYVLILTPQFIIFAIFLADKKINRVVIGAYLLVTLSLLCFFAGGFLQGSYFAG